MNLTCNFRDFADKVRKSLTTGGRHRSASNHECHCAWEDGLHTDPNPLVRDSSCYRNHTHTFPANKLERQTMNAPDYMSRSLIYVVDGACGTPSIAHRRDRGTYTEAISQHVNFARRAECKRFQQPKREASHSSQCAQQASPSTASARKSNQVELYMHSEITSPYSARSPTATKPWKSSSIHETTSVAEHTDSNLDTRIVQGESASGHGKHGHVQRPIRTESSHCGHISSLRLVHATDGNSSSQSQLPHSIPDVSVTDGDLHSGSLGSAYPCYYSSSTKHYVPSSPSNQFGKAAQLTADAQRLTMSHSSLTEPQNTSQSSSSGRLHRNHRHILLKSQHPHQSPCGRSELEFDIRHKSVRSVGVTKPSTEQPNSRTIPPKPVAHRSSSKPDRQVLASTTATVAVVSTQNEHQEVAPVLPTRSTSLFSRAWDKSKILGQYVCTTNESRGTRKPSKQFVFTQKNPVPKVHISQDRSEIVRPTHVRSLSDMPQPSRCCYVNVSPASASSDEGKVLTQSTNAKVGRHSESEEPSSASNPLPIISSSYSTSAEAVAEKTTCILSPAPTDSGSSHYRTIENSTSDRPANRLGNVPSSSSCILLEQCIPSTHASRLLGRMSNKLRDGRLADVVLLAGARANSRISRSEPLLPVFDDSSSFGDKSNDGTPHSTEPVLRIPAHRVILAAASDYFAAMFGNELKEASEMEIWIHDVEPNSLQTLINYIYTGHLNLSETNVEDVLEAACFLQMPEASQACERFLIKRLHGSNCLAMARLGERHGCHLLHRKAMRYALPEFLNLNSSELLELLASDHLSAPNEAAVFAACLRWARHRSLHQSDPSGPSFSQTPLSGVLKFVRLNQLPARLLVDALEKEPLFQNDMTAVRMIVSALRTHLAPEPRTSLMSNSLQLSSEMSSSSVLFGLQEPSWIMGSHSREHLSESSSTMALSTQCVTLSCVKQGPRPSTIGHLWALGGKTMTTTRALQEILEYDPYWNSWRVVGQLPGQRQQCGCIVLRDGRLLVVGGRDELKTLSTVECVHTEELSIQAENKVAITNRDDACNWPSNESGTLPRHTNGPSGDHEMQSLTGSFVENTAQRSGSTEPRNPHEFGMSEVGGGDRPYGWHVVSAMATHRHGLGVAFLEGVVYAVGGHDGWSYLNTVERWNGRAKSWSPVTPMAVQRSTVGVAALDGLLYAVGGRDGSACLRTVERFNPHTQHWCFIAPMLHRRGGVGVGAIGGRLYAVGGHNAPPSQPHALRTASVEMYEPQTDMWTEVACLSSPRDSIAVTALGAKLFALGGHDGQTYTDRVEVYDPETNGWSDVAPLPSGRAGVAVASSPAPSSLCGQFSIRVPFYKADPLA
ncbi:unnamed protein product [Dicrocoelium dendriticum]|nr:unnamed protein product [Dicrocoelium dendriticum]